MALTARVKLLRILSLVQCWMALWFLVLGIVERVRVKVSFVGFPIWTGILIGLTGAVGVQMTFKRLTTSAHTFLLQPILMMTFLGFSLTCAALCCLSISTYTPYLSYYAGQNIKLYHYRGNAQENLILKDYGIDLDPRDKEDHALVGSIFAFTVLELMLALWSVAACLIGDQSQFSSHETCEVPLMVADDHEKNVSGTAYRRECTLGNMTETN